MLTNAFSSQVSVVARAGYYTQPMNVSVTVYSTRKINPRYKPALFSLLVILQANTATSLLSLTR